jgi:hypothetical protein
MNSVSNHEQNRDSTLWYESPWLWLAVIFALFLLLPYAPLPSALAALILFIITTAAYVYAVVQVIALGTRTQLKLGIAVGAFAACLVLWWAMDKWGMPAAFTPIIEARKAKLHPDSNAIFVVQLAQLVSDASLMGAAIFGGGLVARLIKAPNMLGPICGVIALVDIWGVLFHGPVAQIIEKSPEIAHKAMPSLPAAGALSKNAQFAIQPLQIGVGDYLFLGLLFAALHYNNMNWRGTMRLVVPFIFVTLMAVFFKGWNLPGLPAIGLAVAIPNWKYFEFTRDEKIAMFWAGLLVIVLSAAAYFMVQKTLPETKPEKKGMNPTPTRIKVRP